MATEFLNLPPVGTVEERYPPPATPLAPEDVASRYPPPPSPEPSGPSDLETRYPPPPSSTPAVDAIDSGAAGDDLSARYPAPNTSETAQAAIEPIIREEISPTPLYERSRLNLQHLTDSILAPGSDSEPLMSKEVAGVGVRLAGGGARFVSDLLEQMTGLPYKKAEAGVEQGLSEAASEFTRPEGIASLLSFAIPGVAETYAMNVLSKLPEQFGHLKDTIQQHGLVSAETAKAATEAGITDLMGFLAAKGAPKIRAKFSEKFRGANITGGIDWKAQAGKLGLIHKGEGIGLEWFDDPVTKSTISVPQGSTPDVLAQKLADTRAKFAVTEEARQNAGNNAQIASLMRERNRLFLEELPKQGRGTNGEARVQGQINAIDAEVERLLAENAEPLGRAIQAAAPKPKEEVPDAIQERGTTEEVLRTGETGENLASETERVGASDNGEATRTPPQEEEKAASVPVAAPAEAGPEFLESEPHTLKVQDQTFQGTSRADALEQGRLAIAPEMTTAEFLASAEKEPDFSLEPTPAKESDYARQTREAYEASFQAGLRAVEREQRKSSDELFRKIEKLGGLPLPSSPYWTEDLRPIYESKARRLFRKGAHDLDRLRGNMEGAGWDFAVPDDMLNAIQERTRSGKMMFPTRGEVGYDVPPELGGPGAAAGREEEFTKYKERKFSKQIQEDETLLKELRDQAGNRYYEPISQKVTAANAEAVIAEQGIAKAINLIQDEGNGIEFHDRVAIGELIIKKLNEAAINVREAGDMNGAATLTGRAADLAEWEQEYGTRLGRGVATFRLFKALSPEGKLMSTERDLRKRRDKFVQTNFEAIKDAVETAGAEPETPAEKKTRVAREKREGAEDEDKTNKLVEAEQNKIAKQLADTPWWEKSKPGAKNEVLALIRAHLKEEQPSFVERMVNEFDVDPKLVDTIDRLALENRKRIETIKQARQRERRGASINRIADRIADQLSDTPTWKARGVPDPVRQLIAEHLKKPVVDFVRRLTALGAEPKTAESIDRMAAENRERIKKIDRAKRAEQLRKQLTGPARRITKRLTPKEWEKLVELADHGLLTDKEFMDVAGPKLGLPMLTPEQQLEILRLAKEADTLPEGDPRNKKILELNKYIANIKGFDAKDVPLGIYYGNMLSGFNTQAVNAIDTFLNVSSEVSGLALSNPQAARYIYNGMLRGFLESNPDFLLALTEGRMTTGSKWLDAPQLMEVAEFGKKGGVPINVKGTPSAIIKALSEHRVAHPLNYWKYVQRAMGASDSVMNNAAKEARASLLAWRVATGEGLHGDAVRQRVNEILGYDKPATESFKDQASREGFTGKEHEARVKQLRELSRPKDIEADAEDFAGEATYNHATRGTLGFLARNAADVTNKIPAGKFVIAFTNIVANVTNRGLNYSPYGFKRAFFGYGYGKLKEGIPTGDARDALITRATIGTAGLAAIVALNQSGAITLHGAGPSDPERRRQMYDAGWKPYTVQIGNQFISYLQTPVGLTFAAVANSLDAVRYNELGQQDALTRFGYAFSRMGSTVFSQSFLSSLSNFFGMLSPDPAESVSNAKRFISSTTGALTTPRALRDIYHLFDPKLYVTSSIGGDLLRNTVFSSLVNKPAINAFGEPVETSNNRFASTLKSDPIWQWVFDSGVRISVPSKTTTVSDGAGGKRRITPEEYDRYLSTSGARLKTYIETNLDRLRQMSQLEAQDTLRDEAKRIRKDVKDELFP